MLVCTFLLRCSVVCKTKNGTFYTFFFFFFFTYRTQFLKKNLVRHKITSVALPYKRLSLCHNCHFLLVKSCTNTSHCFKDSRLGKKKKFKPFTKIRNFFGGSSKKRFKGDDGGKAHSIGTLGQKLEEDDDDGG